MYEKKFKINVNIMGRKIGNYSKDFTNKQQQMIEPKISYMNGKVQWMGLRADWI